jgi:hypothetical protein
MDTPTMFERGKRAGRNDADRADWLTQLQAQVEVTIQAASWQGGFDARPWMAEYTQGYVIGLAERRGEMARPEALVK